MSKLRVVRGIREDTVKLIQNKSPNLVRKMLKSIAIDQVAAAILHEALIEAEILERSPLRRRLLIPLKSILKTSAAVHSSRKRKLLDKEHLLEDALSHIGEDSSICVRERSLQRLTESSLHFDMPMQCRPRGEIGFD